MLPLARNGFTEQEVKDALHGLRGSRAVRFRYDLLDKNEIKIATIDNIHSGSISFGAFNEIKRTAKFEIHDVRNINFAQDRVAPFMEVRIKPDMWAEFPLGIFHLSSPEQADVTGMIVRDVEAYDGLVILRDDKFDTNYTIPKGTRYYDGIVGILTGAGITKYNIEQTDKVLPIDLVYEIGTTKMHAVNDLISQLNYTPIRVDVFGYFVTAHYISPADRAHEYAYEDNELSVTYSGMTQSLDLFDIPNKWVVVLSNAEQLPLKSVYTNTNENSVTSTISRARTITRFEKVENIADQTSLDAYVARLAFEASQIYGKLKFETAIMPMHEYMDILHIGYKNLSIHDKFAETSWSFDLKAGAKMKHECRRVVNV